ncbi:MAG: PDZ domain-containing protein, partial [Thaumarchaeota archaeon]|nr:PDZ domain-containing protein [Nitrososphaerota archaeon]
MDQQPTNPAAAHRMPLASTQIRYKVTMDSPGTHYFHVSLWVKGFREILGETNSLKLVMPVWTPGSYLVREFARNVLDVSVTDPESQSLETKKETKNTWIVQLGGASEITIDYDVYAFTHASQQSYLDSDHAVINGASVFLYVEGLEHEGLSLKVVPYSSWKKVSTGLTPTRGDPHEFYAENYDTLVDSPFEVGNQRVLSFEVTGVPHEVSIFSLLPLGKEREDEFVSDIKRIVESEVPVFGEMPYERYVFLVNFGENGWGGTEHVNSTLCIIPYLSLDPPHQYRKMLSLFSHEFFHLWNVKRMRPMGLGPFDYSAETYTRSLWVAEGITSYYEDLSLRRAKIYSVPEFLDSLCGKIGLIRSLPSSRHRSAEESSFNAWINHYRPDENTPNVSPSYYVQGAVIGLILDLQIRARSASQRSLDDVMKKVYTETYVKEGRGFTDAEFEHACGAISGESVKAIFDDNVRGRKPIDFERYLGYAGLGLAPRRGPAEPEGFLGVKLGSGVTVASRLSGSPAEDCDLSAGDEIIAVGGLRVDGQKLPFSVAVRKPGSEVKILTAREGVLREVTAVLDAKPSMEYRAEKKDSATPEEKTLFSSWMGASWDSPLQYQDSRPSPARRQSL